MRTQTITMMALLACGGLGVVGCSTDASKTASSISAPAPDTPAPENPAAGTPAAETPAADTPAADTPATPGTGVFGSARSAACETDLQLLLTEVDAFLALNGGTEVTEDQLVAQGLARERSTLHDIGPGATVIPSPTGGCAR